MRSASEFDEAMRRLSIASIESALIQPTIVVPTPMLRSHSYQEESCRRTSTTSITSSDLFGSALYDSLPRTPLAPPRLKLLGNTQIPVSQQLTQLRRLYDAADQEEDSADEEVKRYFRESNNSDSGGGTQCSSSPEDTVLKGTEYSSSWSRLKAKRTIWKIEAQEQTLQRTGKAIGATGVPCSGRGVYLASRAQAVEHHLTSHFNTLFLCMLLCRSAQLKCDEHSSACTPAAEAEAHTAHAAHWAACARGQTANTARTATAASTGRGKCRRIGQRIPKNCQGGTRRSQATRARALLLWCTAFTDAHTDH